MLAQNSDKKQRAPRNQTLDLFGQEIEFFQKRLIYPEMKKILTDIHNRIICGDTFDVLEKLPEKSFDLLFADPPYNLTRTFGAEKFKQTSLDEYENWLDSWLEKTVRLLKPTASIYI
ncbi:MAG: DNA methyltransferase, partial [Pyrinomonadaceae bacterium]